MPTKNLRTVYVVAWHYESGGGFDWYFKPEKADAAFEKEKENAVELARHKWTAYRFNVECDPSLSNDEVTELIDEELDERSVNAAIHFP